jgi:hyperosmotically inducible periplasmic protein
MSSTFGARGGHSTAFRPLNSSNSESFRAYEVVPGLPLFLAELTGVPAGAANAAGGFVMNFRWFIASALLLLALAAPASAQDRRDVRLADLIGRSITGYTQFTIFDDINAQVESGVVTLSGKVTMPYKKQDIERRIARIDGVREVKSTIDVLPVSAFDEELRYRISRAIYGNPSFWNYASMSNPPIHIIVENGRVTLTGVVNSNVDRMLASSLATGFGEFSVTNALRTESERQSE